MAPNREIKNVTCFGGSRDGTDPDFRVAVEKLGEYLGKNGIGIVYGGGDKGLMGAVAVTAHKHGSNVLGILPKAMATPEIIGHVPQERWTVEVVPSMHVRKANMARACDAFIAMPGGFGTMEELFETLTWIQLGIHAKPVVLFNVNGYWDPVIAMVEHAVKSGLISPEQWQMTRCTADPAEVMSILQTCELPAPYAGMNWDES